MADDLEGQVLLEPEFAQEYADLYGPECQPRGQSNPRFIFVPMGEPVEPRDTLVEQMGEVVDDLRQLYTDFGLRPYRVFSVVYSWSGGAEGVGQLSLVSEREFVPTPRVDLGGARNTMTPAGRKQDGEARLREVSPRMTEDEIRAYAPQALPAGQYAFIEVRMDARDGTQVVRRRFTAKDTPQRDAENFQWTVPLAAQQRPRSRAGELHAPQLYPARLRPQEGA